jgi:hypothetical protein
MIVGFTGTRDGMTSEQVTAVVAELVRLRPERVVHGDCIGADADFDAICKRLAFACCVRPCTDSMRAHCRSLQVAEPTRPMERNRAIVADADVLIACPPNYKPIKRGSGTWATVGFGVRAGIGVIVVFPDGTVQRSGDTQ